MKILIWFVLFPVWNHPQHNIDISKVRRLYQQAPLAKPAAREFSALLARVDSSALPVLQCYKGVSMIIEAKYALNPINKLNKFNKGKVMIQSAISLDSLDLEMRFIRLSLQNNLPAFLGYHNELLADRNFLQQHSSENVDIELKAMITQYLTSLASNNAVEKTTEN